MRTLVIGDIHGAFKALIQVLEKAKVTKEDKLIFLGDYVDGWGESAQVADYLIKLNQNQTCIFIKGNHDIWCKEWLNDGSVNQVWYDNGGKETIDSYQNGVFNKNQHLQFYQNLRNYYLDSKNRLFVHAGYKGGATKDSEKILTRDRELWTNAIHLHNTQSHLPKQYQLYSETYIGHTPVQRIGENTPTQKLNVWNIDTGAAFKGKISAMDIDTKEFWQSEPAFQLYPDEIGRN